MTKFNVLNNTFSSGEISDRLSGRTDLAKYFTSCRTMTNMLPTTTGIAISRPGTKYISQALDMNFRSRLLRFEATTDAFYFLEFSNGYFRIFTDDAVLLFDRQLLNNTFDSIVNNWTSRCAGSSTMTWSSGKMALTVVAAAAARGYQAIDDLPATTIQTTVDVTGGTTTWRVGTTIGGSEIGTGSLTTGTGQTFSFTNTAVDQRLYIEFETTTTGTIDNVVFNNPEYKINHPYTEEQLQSIKYAQYNDLLYIVHPSHKPYILSRIGNSQWRFTPWDFPLNTNLTTGFSEGPYLDLNDSLTTLTASGMTGSVTMTASSGIFSSTDVGRMVRYKGSVTNNNDYTYTGTGSQVFFKIPFFPNSSDADVDVNIYDQFGGNVPITYLAGGGTPGVGEWSIVTANGSQFVYCTNPQGTGPVDASSTLIVRRKSSGSAKWGYGVITAYTSSTQVTVNVLSDFSGTLATVNWQLGAFGSALGYPSAVGFHDQRLVFASTTNQPQTIWMSATGHFGDFAPDSDLLETITDASSLNLTMSSNRVTKVRWLESRGELIIGTSGGIYSIKPSSAVGISPLSPPTLRKETSTSSANIEAATSESSVLFIDITQTKVYDLAYSLQSDGYLGAETTILSEHIGKSPISRLTFQATPHPIFWGFRKDGKLVSFLYLKQQDISGWAIHELGGTDANVLDLISVRETNATTVYVLVERTINGATKKYIEKLTPEFHYQDKKEAFFVDSGLTLDQTQTARTLTLSSATVGTGKTFTASSAVFSSGDVGKYIKNTTGSGFALITAYSSTTVVTCTILTAFTSTSISANSWAISATVLSGLSHLEGQTVKIWADGATLPDAVVSSGSITLTTPVFYANVGLGYNRLIKSNRLDFPVSSGTIQGNIGRIHQLTVRLFESLALDVGADDYETSVSFRTDTDILNEGTELFTGDKNIVLPNTFSRDVHYKLMCDSPAPLTIVAVIAKCAISVD